MKGTGENMNWYDYPLIISVDLLRHRLRLLFPHLATLLFKVFSDEFEKDGRSFKNGNDPRWTAINKNDCTLRGLPVQLEFPFLGVYG
jgi:hypothetical protein